jgi:predicted ABC-type ATPase
VETTLSGKNYLQMMQYARGIDRGFEVVLIYIGTERVEINLARIAKRVRTGGHDVPEIDVRRRYLRSMQNLPVAAGIADRVLLFRLSRFCVTFLSRLNPRLRDRRSEMKCTRLRRQSERRKR